MATALAANVEIIQDQPPIPQLPVIQEPSASEEAQCDDVINVHDFGNGRARVESGDRAESAFASQEGLSFTNDCISPPKRDFDRLRRRESDKGKEEGNRAGTQYLQRCD